MKNNLIKLFDYSSLNSVNEFKEIEKLVLDNNICIVSNFISEADANSSLNKIKLFRNKNIENYNYDRLNSKKSFIRRDINPIHSTTKHTFDSYCITFQRSDDELGLITFDIFKKMKSFYNKIVGADYDFGFSDKIIGLRPQIIHYPVGGGCFDWHQHKLNPQKVGLILNLSKPNIDYKSGSTTFKIDNNEVNIYNEHRQGSLALFKYDLVHKVTDVEKNQPLDFNKGRYSAIIPLM